MDGLAYHQFSQAVVLLFCLLGLKSSVPGWKVFLLFFFFLLGFFFPLLDQMLSLINLLFNDTTRVFWLFSFSFPWELCSCSHARFMDVFERKTVAWFVTQMFCVTIVPVFLELVKVYYSQKYLGFSYSLRQSNLKNVFFLISLRKYSLSFHLYQCSLHLWHYAKNLGFFFELEGYGVENVHWEVSPPFWLLCLILFYPNRLLGRL